ncbi:MAG: protein phosphatase 2C domain-containing protein [Methanobacterium sp.]
MAAAKASANSLSKKLGGLLKRNNANQKIQLIPQEKETAVCAVRNKKLSFRYAYARAHESILLGDKGQDYLAFINQGNTFVFALCDGVSQSFYGDIAAKYLGDTLLDWFDHYLPEGMNPEPIQLALNTVLAKSTEAGTQLVNSHPLAADLPPMFKDVLEDKRKLGSETTFIAARVDLPSAAYKEGRAVFAWLGDSRLRIFNDRQEITPLLPGAFETMQRWSSKRGSLGSMVHVYVSTINGLAGIRRVLAYTDGLSSLDGHTAVLSNQILQNLMQQAGEMPTSDDIAMVELLLAPWNNQLK